MERRDDPTRGQLILDPIDSGPYRSQVPGDGAANRRSYAACMASPIQRRSSTPVDGQVQTKQTAGIAEFFDDLRPCGIEDGSFD
jgi:hypothetical protein